MKLFLYSAIFLFITFLSPPRVLSQTAGEITLQELKAELAALRATLDSLKSVPAANFFSDDPLDLLEERLEQRFVELDRKIQNIANSMAPIAFNPLTTAFINMAGRTDSRTVLDAEGAAEIDNRLFLRGVELDFRAPVDPYSEAVVILAIENEAGAGYAIDPEEVYGLIKRLPILESAPWGLKLKVGKFRAPFGVNNRLHQHDLPWMTRPLIVAKFLGTEHGDFFESGFSPVGADLDFFVPNPFSGMTVEMNLDVFNGGDLGMAPGTGSKPGYLAHLNVSRDWRNEHILIGGASWYTEQGAAKPTLLGADLTYKWSPSENRMTTSLVLGGEVFAGSFSVVDSLGAASTKRPMGWYAYAQYQISYSWYVGARYDWLQEPEDPDFVTRSIGVYASYYTTEFFRIRIGLERRNSTLPMFDPLTTGLFELNFVFGSHPTEPYWVNR
ncbi:MAG: hypothetical protein WEB37_09535 [Bacteroidota bacterium]